jgi:hypothetical protein
VLPFGKPDTTEDVEEYEELEEHRATPRGEHSGSPLPAAN